MKRLLPCVLFLLLPGLGHARGVVVKQALAQSGGGREVLTNGGLEQVQDGQIVGVRPWEKGYVVDSAARNGKVAARCDIADPKADGQKGLTYLVDLNQAQPLPFTVELWSKARDVSGGSDTNYSLYVDLEYMDGTPLWGQIATFATGTHDWEKRALTIVPEKPVKTVSFHGIFRGHTGTAWFDDFSLQVVDLPGGCALFDGIPVAKGEAPKPVEWSDKNGFHSLGSGVTDKIICLDNEGRWIAPSAGGLFLRDAKAKSDFRMPLGKVTPQGRGLHFEATDDELGLKVVADYRGQGKVVRIEGYVEDLRGEDRGVSVYCSLGVSGATVWHDDMRTSRAITKPETYSSYTVVGCGANGKMSQYPFGCVSSGGDNYTMLGAPLQPPYLYRFAYDAASKELYGVEDLGLSKDFKASPSRAPFAFLLSADWPGSGGFRGALAEYYQLFPDYFTKRNTTEGNWVAFDDIAGIKGYEDFGIAFKEGTNNPGFDEEHGILTYTYVEPCSYWLAMGKLPRTPEAAQQLLQEQAAAKPPVDRAIATLTSALRDPAGNMQMTIENAPWCDGALFINNPDPDVPTTPELPLNQGAVLWRSINGALKEGRVETTIGDWRFWEEGYQAAPGAGRNGTQAAGVVRPALGVGQGLGQNIVLSQNERAKLTVRAWVKGEGLKGEMGKDFSVYCDLTYNDGTPGWGYHTPLPLGTYDWQPVDLVIDAPKPITTMTLWVLVRGNVTGKVWIDDLSVTAVGSDRNLARNPGLEPVSTRPAVVDGTYFDSLEMGAGSLDFDRRHWAAAQTPLVYTTQDGLPVELLMFATLEFAQDVADKMHAGGKTTFANSALHRFAQAAPMMDLMGTETNWNWGGKFTPMTDRDCNFKRALCYQRPYLLLQNTVFEDFPVEMVDKYMQRALFYGLAPSFFSHNAADATYWTRPEIYNRDRHLFRKYMPAYKAMAAAGWEPVTRATTGNPRVWIERYGKGDNLYFALLNPEAQPQPYTLTVDLKALGVPAKSLQDVIAGQPLAGRAEGDRLSLSGTLQPEQLLVVKVGK